MKKTSFFIMSLLLMASLFVVGCMEENNDTANTTGNQTSGDWVDLGLPSGLLWATRNVGASSPVDYGDHFAWGETQPKNDYSWETYKYASKGSYYYYLTKYCNDSRYGYNSFTDTLTTLQPSDDAAAVNVPGSRLPTKDEWEELINECTWTYKTQNNVKVYQVKGPNGKVLFLPEYDEIYESRIVGLYWSSSLSEDYPYRAYILGFNSDSPYLCDRNVGCSVRPVRSAR